MTSHQETKITLELKRSIVNIQNNINKLYQITSALYQEIHELKRHTNYRAEDSHQDIDTNNFNPNLGQKKTINLNNPVQQSGGGMFHQQPMDDFSGSRKLKIINN